MFPNALHHDLLMSTLPRQDKEILMQVESPGFAFKSEAKVEEFIQSSE